MYINLFRKQPLTFSLGLMAAFDIKTQKKVMTKSVIYIASLLLSIGSISCGNNTKQQSGNSTEEQSNIPAGMEVDSLLANAESLTEKNITVQGICTHTCKHGAKKIFLMGSDDTQTIRIEAGDLGQFSPDCVNSIVEVNGTLKEQRIDEAYLVQWEEKVKAQSGEKHGNGEAGCSTEKKARGESGNTTEKRIADFRKKIAERKAKTGKDYLSFYFVEAESYKITE